MPVYPSTKAARTTGIGSTTTATRLLVAATIGTVVAGVTAATAPWQVAPLLGWTVGASTWALWTWTSILRLDAAGTNALATREEPHRATADLLLLGAAVASLIAVILGVLKAGNVSGGEKLLLLFSGVFSIIASWGVVHTVFTLRYAALYYSRIRRWSRLQRKGCTELRRLRLPCVYDRYDLPGFRHGPHHQGHAS